MGFLDQLGVPTNILGDVNLSGIGRMFLVFGVVFFVLILVGGVVFLYYYRKLKKTQFLNSIPIFTKVHGKLSRIGIDKAKELFIPDTNISLFFLRDKKIYIARPTRSMGSNEYWYYISENGEWINFDLSTSPDDNTLAIANYDHRDTRYAYVNLKEIIKRNYKDKSVKWWQDPKIIGIIGIIIIMVIFTIVMILFFSRTGKMIEGLSPIADKMLTIADKLEKTSLNMQNINSGVVSAPPS